MPKMKAVVTCPKRKGKVEMIEVERPAIGAGEVLIRMRDVGIDGADTEVIEAAHGGDAPEGDDYLILGHESLGRALRPGHLKRRVTMRAEGDMGCRITPS